MENIAGNPGPVQSARRVTLTAQGHLVRLHFRMSAQMGGGQRGVICGFSPDSRKRMLETLARVDVERAGFVAFVTLTYPDREGPPSPAETDRDRQVMLKRMRRRWPGASAIWRREWEGRESGRFVGVPFPHYHLLFFGLPFVPHEDLNALWAEVLGYSDYVRTEIRGVETWRQALYYVSKYMAKVERPSAEPVDGASGDGATAALTLTLSQGERGRASTGRDAGAFLDAMQAGTPAPRQSGSAGQGDGGTAAGEDRPGRSTPPESRPHGPECSLVYGTYLTAQEDASRGRPWGVFNRSGLPWGKLDTHCLRPGPWLHAAKEAACSVYERLREFPSIGFTLFVEDAPGWALALRGLAEADAWDFDEGSGAYDPVPF